MSISDQLRETISKSGLSGNALAKLVGISQATVSRFLSGDDIKLAVADKLAEHFGLTLQPKPRRRK